MKRRGLAVTCLLVFLMAGCADRAAPSGEARPWPDSSSWPAGLQRQEDLKPGAEERVTPALMESDLSRSGHRLVETKTEHIGDVASSVCNNREGPGVYGGEWGEARRWEGEGVKVEHAAFVYGTVTAAQAVAQVKSVLGCKTYRARDGERRISYEGPLPKFADVDGSLFFCETVDNRHGCTTLLAREDILSRIWVSGADEPTVRKVSSDLAKLAAERLAAAW
jgi:hypothetical protein